MPRSMLPAAMTSASRVARSRLRSHAACDGTEYWCRPGKSPREGHGLTLNYQGNDLLHVFTSSVAELEPQRSYSKWGFYVCMSYGGDFRRAAQDAMR
jgi:hypothetical protein